MRLRHQRVRKTRFEPRVGAGRKRLRQYPFEVRIKTHHLHFAGAGEPLLADRAAERKANDGGQLMRIADLRRMFGQRFENRAHVADGHTFFQQVLQYLLQRDVRQRLWNKIVDQRWRVLLHPLDQRLDFAAAEQFAGVRDYQMVQVGRDHRARIDHRVAIHLSLLAQTGVDPDGRQTERRVLGRRARQRRADLARIDRKPLAGVGLADANLDTL